MKVLTFLLTIFILCGSLAADTVPVDDTIPPGEIVIDSEGLAQKSIPATEEASYIVYYFHGNRRCASCMKIENYTHSAVEENYAGQLKDSSVVWKLVNTDEEENKHFLADYQLYTKSVVLSKIVDGKETAWKHLDKVWDLLGDEAAFKKYINGEIEAFIK